MFKSALRKIYLAEQKNFTPAERTEKSRRLSDKFFSRFDLSRVGYLHCFLPISKFNEIETDFIFRRIWRDFPHVQTLAPRVDFQTLTMSSLQFSAATVTIKNEWQIDEPPPGQIIAAEKIDLILIPLLCFDERGFRVGYGKGFYDKFLKKCRADCLKIGLSYFAPVSEILDADDLDVKLDFCVAPDKIYQFRNDEL